MSKTLSGRFFCQAASNSETVLRFISEWSFSGMSEFQSYEIVQSPDLGTCVIIDGDLQSTELDCATYHEALVHPAMLSSPKRPRTVLICGGGEGATLAEVLKYNSVERVVMVDIDEAFIKDCIKYLPEWSKGAFDDPRLELRCEDIFAYLATCTEEFDVIIGDLTDVIEECAPGLSFHNSSFYKRLRGLLSPRGILSTQASALSLLDYKTHNYIRSSIQKSFAEVQSYRAHHDSFKVPWSFILASDALESSHLKRMVLFEQGLDQNQINLEHFDGTSLAASFILEKRIRDKLV